MKSWALDRDMKRMEAMSAARLGGCLLASWLMSPSIAHADAPRRYRLEYRATENCPAESDFARQIEKRAPAATRVSEPPSDVGARVEISKRDDKLHAEVTVTRAEGETRRELDAGDCSELTRAAALIIALAIDPDADKEPVPETPPPAPEPAPTPVQTAPPPPIPAEPPQASSVWLGAGASLGFGSGVAPNLALYEGVFVELGADTQSAFAPTVRLFGLHARGNTETALGKADFDLLAVRLLGCPFRFGVATFVETCASFDLGRLHASGSNTSAPSDANSTWYGPGAALHTGSTVFDVLNVGADLGVVFPLARDRFYFAPDVTAHRVPSLAGYAGFSIGVRG